MTMDDTPRGPQHFTDRDQNALAPESHREPRPRRRSLRRRAVAIVGFLVMVGGATGAGLALSEALNQTTAVTATSDSEPGSSAPGASPGAAAPSITAANFDSEIIAMVAGSKTNGLAAFDVAGCLSNAGASKGAIAAESVVWGPEKETAWIAVTADEKANEVRSSGGSVDGYVLRAGCANTKNDGKAAEKSPVLYRSTIDIPAEKTR